MYTNLFEKLHQRKTNFMKSPDFIPASQSDFVVNLRKDHRLKLASANRKKFIVPIIAESRNFPSLTLKNLTFYEKIDSLLGMENQDSQIQILKAISRIISTEKQYLILSFPLLINRLKIYVEKRFSDDVSSIVLNIFAKQFSGNSTTTKLALDIIGYEILIESLSVNKPKSTEQAILTLVNIAGDCNELRKILIQEQVHHRILAFAQLCNNTQVLSAIAYLFKNLFLSPEYFTDCEIIEIIKKLQEFLNIDDEDLVTNTILALELISKDSDSNIKYFMEYEVLKSVLSLTENKTLYISEPALKIIGNLTYGNTNELEILIKRGALEYIKGCINCKHSSLRKEAYYIISNFVGDSEKIVDFIIESQILETVISKIEYEDTLNLKETSFIFYNLSMIANDHQMIEIVTVEVFHQIKLVIFVSTEFNTLKNFLSFIKKALITGENTKNYSCLEAFESSGIIEKIENLRRHMNTVIFELTTDILSIYDPEESEYNEDLNFLEDTSMPFNF